MTAKLTFNLPEEDYEFYSAVNGQKWRSTVVELDEFLRRAVKDDAVYTACDIRQELHRILSDNSLDFYD